MLKSIFSFFCLMFITFLTSSFVMQQEPKKAIEPKKVIQDSIKKDKTSVAQKEVIIDTLLVEKGNFKSYKQKAHASYYANKFHGKRTASGKIFDMNKLTAAHKKLPFGTKVRVTNEANGKSVVVEVIDRGPFVKGREIDLSRKAFSAIASNKNSGMIIVTLEVLQK